MRDELSSCEQVPAGGRTLPVHGFVLAGGKSSRMGQDKALLPFRGRPMVEIAVEKLRGFCSAISIAGNREDLSKFAPIAPETRLECGPAAGIEAGLKACTQPWALFVPVDVPLVPQDLLRRWTEATLAQGYGVGKATDPLTGSSLYTRSSRQPTFCLLRAEAVRTVEAQLDSDQRRVAAILEALQREFGPGAYRRMSAGDYAGTASEADVETWFSNVNTREDLAVAESGGKQEVAGEPPAQCHTEVVRERLHG